MGFFGSVVGLFLDEVGLRLLAVGLLAGWVRLMSEEVGLVVEGVEREDASDRIKPWTIKGIAPEERNTAIAAADRQGATIGEWLSRAIRTQVQSDHQSERMIAQLREEIARLKGNYSLRGHRSG